MKECHRDDSSVGYRLDSISKGTKSSCHDCNVQKDENGEGNEHHELKPFGAFSSSSFCRSRAHCSERCTPDLDWKPKLKGGHCNDQSALKEFPSREHVRVQRPHHDQKTAYVKAEKPRMDVNASAERSFIKG